MILPITLVFAAAAGILNLWLSIRVSAVRVKGKVLHGDGGNPVMLQRMRAHANFTEYAPFILILMGLIELARGASVWLWVVGAVFVAARLSHAMGMEKSGPSPFRAGGAMLTWAVLLVLSVWAAVIGYQGTETTAAKPAVMTLGT